MRRVTAIAILVLTAGAAPADAGTITISKGREGVSRENGFWVTYTAAVPGRANHVTAKWDRATLTYTITDTAEPIVPLPGGSEGPGTGPLEHCQYRLHTATCRPQLPYGGERFILKLGDGDDTARIENEGSIAEFWGEAGDDVLRSAGDGSSYFYAGDGADTIAGGPGQDWVLASNGGDRLSGGAGEDTVSYRPNDFYITEDTSQNPAAGVRISPDGVADDGQPGEGDDVGADFERFLGSDFGDVILGGPAGEEIDAWAGDDRISGGPGRDTISGGGGADVVETRDGEADRFSCGDAHAGDAAFVDPLDVHHWPWVTCPMIEVEP